MSHFRLRSPSTGIPRATSRSVNFVLPALFPAIVPPIFIVTAESLSSPRTSSSSRSTAPSVRKSAVQSVTSTSYFLLTAARKASAFFSSSFSRFSMLCAGARLPAMSGLALNWLPQAVMAITAAAAAMTAAVFVTFHFMSVPSILV